MSDNNTLLRTTTISLDEYNKLVSEVASLRETKGVLQNTMETIAKEKRQLEEKQPLVKVVHYEHKYGREYNDYIDDYEEVDWLNMKKVDYVNLSDVTTMATSQAKKQFSSQIDSLKTEVQQMKATNDVLRDNIDTLENRIDVQNKQLKKEKSEATEKLNDLREQQLKYIKAINKAYSLDTDNYKEAIKELKEEIKKVKDGKTDAEVEEKRNSEIKDLKNRIRDLERILNDLESSSFIERFFKLRKLVKEQNTAAVELREREIRADSVGITWVKEEGRTRKYNRFNDLVNKYWITNWF